MHFNVEREPLPNNPETSCPPNHPPQCTSCNIFPCKLIGHLLSNYPQHVGHWSGQATIPCQPSSPLTFLLDLLGQTWGSTCRFLQTNLNMRSIMHAFAPTTLVVGNTFCSLFPPLVLSWVIFVVNSVCTKVHLFPRGLINVLPRNCQECCALCWCGGENVNSKWTSIWRYEVIVFWQLECSPFPWSRSLCRGIFTTCE